MYTGEADLVLHYLKKLDMAGVSLNLVAVITPYNLQVLLRLHAMHDTYLIECGLAR